MKCVLSSLLVAATLALATAPALAADSPFVGIWKIDRAKSSVTGDTFSYTAVAGGKLEFAYGTTTHYAFACDGSSFATDIAGYTGTCTKTGSMTYAFTSSAKGKLTDKDAVSISADGKTFTDVGTHFQPNGKTAHDTSTYARVGSGTGIVGTWKTAKVSSSSPSSLSFTSTPAGLEMSNLEYNWKVVLKADGSKSMLSGPTVPVGAYVVAKADGPSAVRFKVKIGERTFSDNTIKVSDAGTMLSWTSQAPGNSATTSVYDKK